MSQKKPVVLKKQWFVQSHTDSILDYYDIVKELGSGAYGKVILGVCKTSGVERAIKIVQKDRVQDYETFLNEVSILRELDHPHIVRIVESFETDRLCFFVMDYCSGGELFQRISKNKRLTEVEAASIIRRLFSAVAYCHSHGVCHRDLKPENCLFVDNSPESEIKLIDFGLAQNFTEDEVMHSLNGTPYYIAPEVLTGSYTHVVDCWSLGVILYIMLSGTPPFGGKNNQEILMNVYGGAFTFRPRAFQEVSNAAKDLIARLLVKEPTLRYTADQALSHPWITGYAPLPNKVLPNEVFEGIKHFEEAIYLRKAALMYISSRLSDKDVDELRTIFISLDRNGDGVLTEQEMTQGFLQANKNIDPETLHRMCDIMDTNLNGLIDYSEFLTACLHSRKNMNLGLLKTAFMHFDQDKSGHITADELRAVLGGEEHLTSLSPSEIDAMIQEADINKDGVVDYMEFLHMMNQRF